MGDARSPSTASSGMPVPRNHSLIASARRFSRSRSRRVVPKRRAPSWAAASPGEYGGSCRTNLSTGSPAATARSTRPAPEECP
jgi:hypothetical protein